jgi:hypothetical protein
MNHNTDVGPSLYLHMEQTYDVVGDLSKQNGSFSIEMSEGKQERLVDKVKQGFRCKLTNDDITWLLYRA